MKPDETRTDPGMQISEELVNAIVNLNCPANLATVQRTRRVLRDAAFALEERRLRQRRNTAFALVAFLMILIFLAPAVWNSAEDILNGEHLADLPAQAAFLLLTLTPAMLAALAAVWKEQRDIDHRRRNF
jgi:drug/metabolite transporter (DMT)-like permease